MENEREERCGKRRGLRVCLVWVGMAGCAVVRDGVHRTGDAVVGGGGGAEERRGEESMKRKRKKKMGDEKYMSVLESFGWMGEQPSRVRKRGGHCVAFGDFVVTHLPPHLPHAHTLHCPSLFLIVPHCSCSPIMYVCAYVSRRELFFSSSRTFLFFAFFFGGHTVKSPDSFLRAHFFMMRSAFNSDQALYTTCVLNAITEECSK